MAGLNILVGSSTTPVDVYLTAIDANGVSRWWDNGSSQWATGLASPLFPSGTVTVDTDMGPGATFRVFIPRASLDDSEDSVAASEASS